MQVRGGQNAGVKGGACAGTPPDGRHDTLQWLRQVIQHGATNCICKQPALSSSRCCVVCNWPPTAHCIPAHHGATTTHMVGCVRWVVLAHVTDQAINQPGPSKDQASAHRPPCLQPRIGTTPPFPPPRPPPLVSHTQANDVED